MHAVNKPIGFDKGCVFQNLGEGNLKFDLDYSTMKFIMLSVYASIRVRVLAVRCLGFPDRRTRLGDVDVAKYRAGATGGGKW